MSDDEIKRRLDDLDCDMQTIMQLLQGKDGELGIAAKVHMLWRTWVWLLCAISGVLGTGIGALITLAVTRVGV